VNIIINRKQNKRNIINDRRKPGIYFVNWLEKEPNRYQKQMASREMGRFVKFKANRPISLWTENFFSKKRGRDSYMTLEDTRGYAL